jgi:hypothetical protein
MKSLPPLVTGATQWILRISLLHLQLHSKPKITLQWWGNEDSDTMIYSQNKYSIEYHIKCSIKQFEEYCRDLGDLEFTLTDQGKKGGTITVSDFEVLRNPPVHKNNVPIVSKGKQVGQATMVMQIVGTNTPNVVRNSSSSKIPKPKSTPVPIETAPEIRIPKSDEKVVVEEPSPPHIEEVTVEYVEPESLPVESFVQRHDRISSQTSLVFEPFQGDYMTPVGSSSDLPSLISDEYLLFDLAYH